MSFAAALSRATQRVLARAGEGALLRGVATQHPVHVARDVEIIDGQGNLVVVAYVATIHAADAPEAGDPLVIQAGPNAGTYVLEVPVDDSGYTSRRVIRKVA